MASSATKRRVDADDSNSKVLDEEEQERIIAELVASWTTTERWHRVALTVLGVALILLKLLGMEVPFGAHPAWDFLSAALFCLSLAALFTHRLVAIAALALSGVLTLLWLPVVDLGDQFTLITLLWFGGINVLYAGSTYHFRITAASSKKDLRRLAELQFPCKQA